MKRSVLIIGIGAGDPTHLTVQAIEALNRASVFFIPDKGTDKSDLAQLRREIIGRFVQARNYRCVNFDYPVRDSGEANYRKGVAAWHAEVEDLYVQLLSEELDEGEWGAFLAWGDPGLYDSILRILKSIDDRKDLELEYEVIPGISSVQALAAAHKIPLNRIGESILITTGRKLLEGLPANADSIVVMLDGEASFRHLDGDLDIYWGAYVGTDDEILVSGKLRDVAEEIERVRAEARAKKGWIMDTYLLRRSKSQ